LELHLHIYFHNTGHLATLDRTDAFVWAVVINPPRTVGRKCSLGWLYVCAGLVLKIC